MSPQWGDYGCVKTGGIGSALIRFGTHAPVNHAFIYVGDGRIVEGEPGGARIGIVEEYTDIHWSNWPLTDAQRYAIRDNAMQMVGTPYGWLDIAALTFACIGIKSKWIAKRIESQKTLICSQLVDRAYLEAGVQLFDDGRLPGEVTPGDLYRVVAPVVAS